VAAQRRKAANVDRYRQGGGTAMGNQSDRGRVTAITGAAGVKFWTVAEVAERMRVSKMSVYRLIHSGQLEAVQFGRSFRISEQALEKFMKSAYYQTG
jgi:excisionase family DNA binding protein